jgi:uncharacterized protein DUF5947
MMPASTESDYLYSPADLHALRRFLRMREPALAAQEYCQMCATPLASSHRHMLDLAKRGLLCACEACALLFASQGAGQGKYRLIPRRVLALQNFRMTDEQWDELMLPVNMLYLFRSTEAGRMQAFYPSPAGAMESLLHLENWETLLKANPLLNELEPDVEALLINRIEQKRAYYLVPIDICYRLVGLLRVSWQGLSGGQETWESVASFFAELQAQATPASASSNHTDQSESAEQAGTEASDSKGGGDAHA